MPESRQYRNDLTNAPAWERDDPCRTDLWRYQLRGWELGMRVSRSLILQESAKSVMISLCEANFVSFMDYLEYSTEGKVA